MIAAARIGPNAISQMTVALERSVGRERTGEFLRRTGFGAYLDAPPLHMVDEVEVIALHAALRSWLPPAAARHVAHDAGCATGDYLLRRRIPAPARALLRLLPATLAARLLLVAIRRHAWTFAGSGRFEARAGHPLVITIKGCPICRDAHAPGAVCDYYSATFERLFSRLVHPASRVRETECGAAGAAACRFEIDWH